MNPIRKAPNGVASAGSFLSAVAKRFLGLYISCWAWVEVQSSAAGRILHCRKLSSFQLFSLIAGVLLLIGIVTYAEAASAQLFETAETQIQSIFDDSGIDEDIISFMFGMLRVVIWVTSVGFILFAVYQAQRGEQWQPLMQNAFIVVAAVVVVEGVSKLFFGGGTT